MLLLLHILIPCVALYILSFGLCPCFSNFGTVIPTSFNILMEIFLHLFDFLLFTWLRSLRAPRVCEPHPFCCSSSYETHVSNNEEIYPEARVIASYDGRELCCAKAKAKSPSRPPYYKDSAGERHSTRVFEVVWYNNQGKYV